MERLELHRHAQAPPLFGREDVREKLRKLPGGPTQPLTVHLRQEIDRLNMIITLTTTTLKNVRLAIAGMCLIQTVCQLSCSYATSLSCTSLVWQPCPHHIRLMRVERSLEVLCVHCPPSGALPKQRP